MQRVRTHIPTGCESLFTSFQRLKESKLLQKRLNQGNCNTLVLTRLFCSLKWNLIKWTFFILIRTKYSLIRPNFSGEYAAGLLLNLTSPVLVNRCLWPSTPLKEGSLLCLAASLKLLPRLAPSYPKSSPTPSLELTSISCRGSPNVDHQVLFFLFSIWPISTGTFCGRSIDPKASRGLYPHLWKKRKSLSFG